MGKKIRSFTDYQAAKAERERTFEERVESELERLIRKDARKTLRDKRPIAIYAPLHRILEATVRGRRGLVKLYVENKRSELQGEVKRQLHQQQFRENVQDLVRCGVYLSQMSAGGRADERQRLYVHFLDELKELSKNRYCQTVSVEVPEISELLHGHTAPPGKEEIGRVRAVLIGLQKKEYLTKKNAVTLRELLTPSALPEGITVSPSTHTGSGRKKEKETTLSTETGLFFRPEGPERYDEQVEYLTALFRLSLEVAQRYAGQITLSQLDELHERLKEVVGNQAVALVNRNPVILTYQTESKFTKYITTLNLVTERIKRNGSKGVDLTAKYGVENNLERYADLEQLLALKRELFTELGEYVSPETPSPQQKFEIEAYKSKLLQRAGLEESIVRAFTEGKTSQFKGEAYIPKEYFRKNAIGKVDASTLSQHFEDTFQHMIKTKAITRKHKATPLYRLNPHLNKVTDPFLREYMRVTLYYDQILAQEGEIKPLLNMEE